VQRVGADAVAHGEECMGWAKHLLVARGADGIGADQVRDPPSAQLAEEKQSVADPEPPEKPVRIGLVEVDDAGGEAECVGGGAEQRGGEKFGAGVCGADSCEVVERAEREPIVQDEEQHDESLQGELRVHGGRVHEERDYT